MSVLTLILPLASHTELKQLTANFSESIMGHLHSLSSIHTDEKQAQPTMNKPLVNIVTEHQNDHLIIHIKPNLPGFELNIHGEALYKATAEWLAAYILQHYEHTLLQQAIRKRGFTDQESIQKIESYCQSILNHEQWEGLSRLYTEVDRKRRINKIVHELYQFFSYEVVCQLEGILAFRLRPYKKEIKDIVEYACDEYILNQQYEEFISLLKYFVQIQECKIDTVHVMQDDRGLELYDEHFNSVSVNDYEERIVVDMIETEINIEDSVISHLVAVSPKKIILHMDSKDVYETKTVKSIFSERIELCHGCHLCRSKNSEMLPFN